MINSQRKTILNVFYENQKYKSIYESPLCLIQNRLLEFFYISYDFFCQFFIRIR